MPALSDANSRAADTGTGAEAPEIGTLLGNNHINIANFALGRSEGNHHAVGVVNVDSEINDEVLRQIGACPSIQFDRVIQL